MTLYSFGKVAKYLGLSRNTVAKLVEVNKIPVVHLPNQKRISEEGLDDLILVVSGAEEKMR